MPGRALGGGRLKRIWKTCAGLLATLACCSSVAQDAVPDAAAERELAGELQRRLTAVLTVPADLAVDASLREAGAAMASEHVARMEPVLRQWVAEERSAAPGLAIGHHGKHLFARFVNELSLWHIDSAGHGHDEVMLGAISKPGICRLIIDRSHYAWRLLLVQAVPAAQREAALAGERELLGRWGTSRPSLPARPVPSQHELEQQAIAQIKTGKARFDRALPPLLASQLLRDDKETLGRAATCALHQWWLSVALRKGGAQRDDVLNAYRYAMMPVASDLLTAPSSASSATPAGAAQPYPPFANYYGVEGRITVESTIDAGGRFKHARVVDRVVTVAGIRNTRPVAFETALDEGSIAQAAALSYPKPEPSGLKDGTVTGRVPIGWRLE